MNMEVLVSITHIMSGPKKSIERLADSEKTSNKLTIFLHTYLDSPTLDIEAEPSILVSTH